MFPYPLQTEKLVRIRSQTLNYGNQTVKEKNIFNENRKKHGSEEEKNNDSYELFDHGSRVDWNVLSTTRTAAVLVVSIINEEAVALQANPHTKIGGMLIKGESKFNIFDASAKSHARNYLKLNTRMSGMGLCNADEQKIIDTVDYLRGVAGEDRLIFHLNQIETRDLKSGHVIVSTPFGRNTSEFCYVSLTNILERFYRIPLCIIIDSNRAGILANTIKSFKTDIPHLDEEEKVFAFLSTGFNKRTKILRPKLPLDFFSYCLTNPVQALCYFVLDYFLPDFNITLLDSISGDTSKMQTPLGGFHWFLQGYLSDIAGALIPPNLYRKCFRKDNTMAIIFRNYLLARKLSAMYGTITSSIPDLPNTNNSIVWNEIFKFAKDFLLDLNRSLQKNKEEEYQLKFIPNRLLKYKTKFERKVERFMYWTDMRAMYINTFETKKDYFVYLFHGLGIAVHCIKSRHYRREGVEIICLATRTDISVINYLLLVGFPFYLKHLYASKDTKVYSGLIYLTAKLIAFDKNVQEILDYNKSYSTLFFTYLKSHTSFDKLLAALKKMDYFRKNSSFNDLLEALVQMDYFRKHSKATNLPQEITDIQVVLDTFIIDLNTVYYALYSIREFFRLGTPVKDANAYGEFFKLSFEFLLNLSKFNFHSCIMPDWLNNLKKSYDLFIIRYNKVVSLIQRECFLLLYSLCKWHPPLQVHLSLDAHLRSVCEIQNTCKDIKARCSAILLLTVFKDIWQTEDMLVDVVLFYLFTQVEREANPDMRIFVLLCISSILDTSGILYATENEEIITKLCKLLSKLSHDISPIVRKFAFKCICSFNKDVPFSKEIKDIYFKNITSFDDFDDTLRKDIKNLIPSLLEEIDEQMRMPDLLKEESVWLLNRPNQDEFQINNNMDGLVEYPISDEYQIIQDENDIKSITNLSRDKFISLDKLDIELNISESVTYVVPVYKEDMTRTVFLSYDNNSTVVLYHSYKATGCDISLIGYIKVLEVKNYFQDSCLFVTFNRKAKGIWFSILDIRSMRISDTADYGLKEYLHSNLIKSYVIVVDGVRLVYFLFDSRELLGLDIKRKRVSKRTIDEEDVQNVSLEYQDKSLIIKGSKDVKIQFSWKNFLSLQNDS